MELREHIDSLATGEEAPGGHRWDQEGREGPGGVPPALSPVRVPAELCRINEDQKVALDLDPYVKKLLNARRRVVLVNNILQNAQVGAGRGLRRFLGGSRPPPGADGFCYPPSSSRSGCGG